MMKVVYVEPKAYIPEELRKEYHLGEYEDEKKVADIKATVETKNGTIKAGGIEEIEKLLESLDKKTHLNKRK